MSHGAAGMDPTDVYRYHTRHIPSLTIMRHSITLERTGKHDPNFAHRAHDVKIIDDDLPREAAQLLLLDLNISMRNLSEHRIVVMSSPYMCCLQTATIVAQELGLDSIQVYYDFGRAVFDSRDAGWDFAYEPLTVSRSEMEGIVAEKSREGEERYVSPAVHIDCVLGTELTSADLNENEVNYAFRLGAALDQAVASLERDGDHVVVIADGRTIRTAAKHFVPGLEVLNVEAPCGYVTVASPSDGSSWLAGRSKVKLRPEKSKDLSKKILNQLDTPFGQDDT
jgi:broad specificity phosphatase PhoE